MENRKERPYSFQYFKIEKNGENPKYGDYLREFNSLCRFTMRGDEIFPTMFDHYFNCCKTIFSENFPNVLNSTGERMSVLSDNKNQISLEDSVFFIALQFEAQHLISQDGFQEVPKKKVELSKENAFEIMDFTSSGFGKYYELTTGKKFERNIRDAALEYPGKNHLGLGNYDFFYDRIRDRKIVEDWVGYLTGVNSRLLRCCGTNFDENGGLGIEYFCSNSSNRFFIGDNIFSIWENKSKWKGKSKFGAGLKSKRFEAFSEGHENYGFSKPSILHPFLRKAYSSGEIYGRNSR